MDKKYETHKWRRLKRITGDSLCSRETEGTENIDTIISREEEIRGHGYRLRLKKRFKYDNESDELHDPHNLEQIVGYLQFRSVTKWIDNESS